jgi:hypothetical protein
LLLSCSGPSFPSYTRGLRSISASLFCHSRGIVAYLRYLRSMAGNWAEEHMKGAWVRVIPAFAMGIFLLASLSACAGRRDPVAMSDAPAEPPAPSAKENPSPAIIEVLGGVVGGVTAKVASGIILASAYDYLYGTGIEQPHYGLYTYVLFPAPSPLRRWGMKPAHRSGIWPMCTPCSCPNRVRILWVCAILDERALWNHLSGIT